MSENKSSSTMLELGWGCRYLMCAPTYFDVRYGINPWMRGQSVDARAAATEWQSLAEALEAAGATIELCPPVPDLPDMVFAANAAVIDAGRAIPSRFRHPQRVDEAIHYRSWLVDHGFAILDLPDPHVLEGTGDVLPHSGVLVAGYGQRSALASVGAAGSSLARDVLAVELVDPRLYHLDLAFCPLTEASALIAPMAFTAAGLATLLDAVDDPVLLEDDEALGFMANSLVVGRTIVMPACSDRLAAELERRGLTVVVVEVHEFLKAGGACRCLALALDVDLG